ncbi:hypothetical protein [Nocardioides sp.]|uniref:hypothetical protein n=1 Tax=Nocardioides sp. TaxID=35761 RepID=UPI001A257DA6|nr:hypothetical protein [Nocardioides sp.]MBJ7357265.1 hypothetical protein [Nocardioides sp.]
MKKTLIGLFTALFMAAGLQVATATSAQAVCTSYAGCVDTQTKASGPKVVARKKRATVCGTTTAVGSNVKPSGDLRFVVTRNVGKFRFARTVPYFGGKMCIRTKKLQKTGGYTLHVTFLPKDGSLFNSSSGSHGFDVGR